MRSFLLPVLLALTVAAAACGKGPAIAAPADDVATAETSTDSSVKDAADKDTPGDVLATADTTGDAVTPPGDGTATTDATTACSGGPRCPCTGNSECDSGLCLEPANGHVCAAPCADSSGCLVAETCTTLNAGGGDIQSYCTPKWVSTCAPCKQNAECAYPGSGGSTVCAPLGDAGSFCTTSCAATVDCPPGFTCSAGTCHPPADTCACTPWAVAHNATTTCLSSNAAGKCSAEITCAATGPWPVCLAATPAPESCNGQDDDCNGLTDEASDASCKDADGCTQDVCSGGSCQHLKNVVCGDGICADKCGETKEFCPIDCHVCGNNVCETGESPKSCAKDCCGVGGKPGACGDGVCSGYECGESTDNCKSDCTAPCGNKLCEVGESKDTCPGDCSPACGNGICEPGDGGPAGCPKDCAASCGNCTCEGTEDSTTCPNDCGHCGDGLCSVCYGLNEDAKSCPSDCSDLKLIGCTLTWQLFCKDGSPCTTDDCVTGKGCVHLAASGACTDGNACTVGDVCVNAVCAPGAQVFCDDGVACTKDACDVAAGCTVTVLTGTPCNDGDACTLGDKCLAGACNAGKPAPCDDFNPCTDDSCDSQNGACVNLAASGTCSDGNACTVGESCVVGLCDGGTPVDCDDGNDCTQDYCQAKSGCSNKPLAVGGCDDGDGCTVNDKCVIGTCTPGSALACGDGNACTDDGCSGGVCLNAANTATCDDGNACTLADGCLETTCHGKPNLCDDGTTCTTDSCDGVTGGCINTPVQNGTGCDDGDLCTLTDVCSAGACAGTAVVCTASDQCHDVGTCAGGTCSDPAKPDTTACDDGSGCTKGDACAGGACIPGTVNCDDGNACTADSCDVNKTCQHGNLADWAVCGEAMVCNGAGGCQDVKVGKGMAYIPAATFWMGCNATKYTFCSAQSDENPQHKVTLSAYYMDLTETTVGQYKACVDAGGCTAPSSVQPTQDAAYPGLTNNPVNFVNWTQSQAYCKWRGSAFDLPTEAQWEMAARGGCEKNGSTAGDAGCAAAMRTNPWGEAAATCSYAVMSNGTYGCGTGATWAVGSIPAGDSPYGLHDMAGNVMEWNRDWYSEPYYGSSPATDPFNSDGASGRVVRGGSFYDDAGHLRAGRRTYYGLSDAGSALGLRCSRSSP